MCKKSLFAIRMVTVLLEIMMTITAVCERGFSCMNRENSLQRKRLGKDTPLDHIMRINIDGPSLVNFDTEKLIGLNCRYFEAREEATENVIVF